MIEPGHPEIAIDRQCDLIGLSRSSYYYELSEADLDNVLLMRLLDEQFTKTPFYGVEKMTAWLRRKGYVVNPKRVRRLLRLMGIEAIYSKPRLSLGNTGHLKYPYLLRNLAIVYPNQVWSTDITYIRMKSGFVYLVAVIDWYSRYVLAWELSNTLDTGFCVSALERAFRVGVPEIFNTDQGVQFTSDDFTKRLLVRDIRISMDGRGRALDNIFVERLWRSVKYEEVYLNDYLDVRTAKERLGCYFDFYNTERPHQSLGYATPEEIYCGKALKQEQAA
jgi:putative transposase